MIHWRNDAGGVALLAAGALALLLWTAHGYTGVTVALVAASLAQFSAALWSCRVLVGTRAAWLFLGIGVVLGWIAEQCGATLGWFFGSYHYTEVLGPRLGAVPVVIPLMWFGLTQVGFVLASLLLWRAPVPAAGGWKPAALTALLAGMVVTAFDLGADPYFVYQLKAWIMEKPDGGWFGETVRGFEGWMLVSTTIVLVFQALARPRLHATDPLRARHAALVPIVLYAGMLLFQLFMLELLALKVIALFAMGLPTLIAAVAWQQWSTPVATRIPA